LDKSENIREWIRGKFNENHDFSNKDLTRRLFKEYFESQENQKLEINLKTHQSLFIKCLKQVCKEKKIPVQTYGYAEIKPKFTQSTGAVKTTITPKPKGTDLTTTEGQPQPKTSTETGQVITPMTEEQAIKLTRICWRICGSVIHAWKEKFDKFDKDELDELAIAWEPLLKPYLERFGGKIAIALFVTAGVFSKRADAFKSDKQLEKEKKEKAEKKSEKTEKIEVSDDDKKKFEEWKKKH